MQPTGLLQRHTTLCAREADETPAVGAERCRADDTVARRCDHISPILRQYSRTVCRLQGCLLGIPDRLDTCLSGRRLSARR